MLKISKDMLKYAKDSLKKSIEIFEAVVHYISIR